MVSDLANLFCISVVRTTESDPFFDASCFFCFTDRKCMCTI